MRTRLKRWSIIAVGWIFILLGIVGLFLPVLQGVLFIVIGLLILSTEYVWAHHLLRKLLHKFPGVEERLSRAPKWLRRLLPHWFHERSAAAGSRPQ